MKLSITMMSFSDYIKSEKMTVKDFIDISAGFGFDAVDLLDYYWVDKEREVREAPKLLKDAGVELGAFCIGNNFILEPEEREIQLGRVKTGIETAARLGATKLRVFGGHWTRPDGTWGIPEDVDKEKWIEIVSDCLTKCVNSAKENGVIMALENHNHMPLSIYETAKIIETVNSPYLRLNFDIGNFFVSAGEDPVSAAKALGKYIAHVHVKDAVDGVTPGRRYDFCPVGDGFIPVKETLSIIKNSGYDGYLTLEYEGWKIQESKTGAKKSLEYLRKILPEI